MSFLSCKATSVKKYALGSGEPAAVADAIFEHYLPRGAGDRLPTSTIGQVVGIADRLDTLVSIFSIGKLTKGQSETPVFAAAGRAAKMPLSHIIGTLGASG